MNPLDVIGKIICMEDNVVARVCQYSYKTGLYRAEQIGSQPQCLVRIWDRLPKHVEQEIIADKLDFEIGEYPVTIKDQASYPQLVVDIKRENGVLCYQVRNTAGNHRWFTADQLVSPYRDPYVLAQVAALNAKIAALHSGIANLNDCVAGMKLN